MEYNIKDDIEYDMNTQPRARDIAKDILAVIQNPTHEHAEYILRRAINKVLYGVPGELNIREGNITLGDFLRNRTEVGQVVRIQKNRFNCYMVEVDDEDMFIGKIPGLDKDKVIKNIDYDYSQRVNELPIITINIIG